jgi:outer membrane protein, heavy metal efflux system
MRLRRFAVAICACMIVTAFALRASAQTQGPVKITLDEALQLALQHNHTLLAARTTIQQSQAEEVTANLRPNPTIFGDFDYLPLSPSAQNGNYFDNLTEVDFGLTYLFERGKKRQHRLAAAQDQTTVTRSQVTDNERTLTFQVASQFITVQLSESTLDLAQQDLLSFQKTVDLNEERYRVGGISRDDVLKIQLQLLQFQTDVSQALLARVQALAGLRQLVGYESVPTTYDVAGELQYTPIRANLEDLQAKALQTRPDLRAAQQGITAANSAYAVQRTIAKQDVSGSINYSHVNGISAISVGASIPLAIFDRNQGEIARTRYAITQAQELETSTDQQVLTDVEDAYEAVITGDTVMQIYRSGYLAEAEEDRDISEYAYQRGATNLIDFLDAERSYRAIQLSYRQALASYATSMEQLREAIGTGNLP